MQIKIITKYNLTPVRMAFIKILKITSTNQDMRKGEPLITVAGNAIYSSHHGKQCEVFSTNQT
jgi:hypothetical protein